MPLFLAVPVAAAPLLPAPTENPQNIDFTADPLLALIQSATPPEPFLAAVRTAALTRPETLAAEAGTDEARALRGEARSALFPRFDAQLIAARQIASDFGAFTALVESLQPAARTDLQLSAQQLLFDFGATGRRIAAASADVRAARAGAEAQAQAQALAAIAAWYDVLAGAALDTIAADTSARLARIADDTRTRQAAGLGTGGDVARAEAGLAEAAANRARIAVALADARARFAALYRRAAPPLLERPAAPASDASSADAARLLSGRTPLVAAADARADAARQLARAVRADRLPLLSAGLTATRYDVFDHNRDYDVRGQITLHAGFSAGGAEAARARAAQARARAASYAEDAARSDAERDAASAFDAARILDANVAALDTAYRAGRRARDVTAEQYRLSRGSLLDLLRVEQEFSASAAALLRGSFERDLARYALLARTGALLPLLGLNPETPR